MADAAVKLSRAFGASGVEESELVGLIFVDVAIPVVLAVACMGAAALGAGSRLLWWWLR